MTNEEKATAILEFAHSLLTEKAIFKPADIDPDEWKKIFDWLEEGNAENQNNPEKCLAMFERDELRKAGLI